MSVAPPQAISARLRQLTAMCEHAKIPWKTLLTKGKFVGSGRCFRGKGCRPRLVVQRMC